MSTQIKSMQELSEVLEDVAAMIVVRTALNDLYLVTENEDGDIGYQGFPIAEDEDGEEGEIDRNNGWASSWLDFQWPLTYLGCADPEAVYPNA